MAYLAGVDLGTSSLKVIIIDEFGNTKAFSNKPYQFDSPVNGYAEQNAVVWWKACCECLREALSKLGKDRALVKGISFSGQMHGIVFLDKNFKEIRPAILHCDARAYHEVAHIKSALGEEKVKNLLLNPIYTGFLLPSLLWVRNNEPANYAKIAHVLLPKDYLRFMFTGDICSDYSDASATLAFDIVNMAWCHEVLDALNVSRDIFPKCFPTTHVMGRLTSKAAQETGLPLDIKVINGGGDQTMQCIGNGAISPGMATVNIGTSGQVCFQSQRPIKNPSLNTNTFCSYEKGRWFTMGATMSAGLSLKWLNSLFENTDYDLLNSEIENVPIGSNGLIFLPYLMGERTPHLNPNLSSMFMGIQVNTKRRQMTRAVMEGVAYSLYQCMELCKELDLTANECIASGGGARSKPWLQLQADIYNTSLKTAETKEQACLGAAITAGVGSGVYESMVKGCETVVKYNEEIYYPNEKNHQLYMEYYQLFKDAYISNKTLLEKLTFLGRKR